MGNVSAALATILASMAGQQIVIVIILIQVMILSHGQRIMGEIEFACMQLICRHLSMVV
jgi:hypothetical protein